MKPGKRSVTKDDARAILHHWREAVPNDRLAHLVKDARRSLIRALQVRLREESVSFGHWTFLRILWETDGITQRELSVQAGVMEPTTTQAIKAMEKLGYLTRRQLPDSKKKIYIFLTSKGLSLKSKLVPLAEQVNAIAVRGIPTEEVSVLRNTLLKIIENLAQDEMEGPAEQAPTANVRTTAALAQVSEPRPRRAVVCATRLPGSR
jgi:DNA-binding MarR family transcriptional regulator